MEGWRGTVEENRTIMKTKDIRQKTDIDILRELKGYFKGDLRLNEDMSSHTTLRIGGLADIYAIPDDVLSLKNILIYLSNKEIPVIPFGGGSNILVSDTGIYGAVISSLSLKRIEVIGDGDSDSVRLFVESGTSLQALLNFSKKEGLSGLEGLAGIPGTLGGAVKGNAGSFGIEIGDVIESIALMDLRGNISIINREGIGFRYRGSDIPEGFVLSAIIRLKRDDPQEVAKRINYFHDKKREKQPLTLRSAGCVFKNPEGLKAGRLIDEAGCKGMRIGDIEVSSRHANFFINRGNGKASDFLSLIEEVKKKVINYCGIELEPEIRII